MKIRTRLLLFLLPTLVCSIALVSTLLSFNWYREIVEGFRTKLRAAVITTSNLFPTDHQLEVMKQNLGVTSIYFVPIDSPDIDMIPKNLHITPIYQSKEGQKIMTGYAPVFDANGYIKGLMAADLNVSVIDKKFQESLFLIILCAGFTILIVVATLFFIAHKIARPVAKLNNSALAIAAGQYGDCVKIKGPKEIAELANTLNTMSECLHENINRLKENSLLRERMYGEYESSMLLQHMMLQKNIDDCRSDAVAIKSITFFSESPKGFLLDFPKQVDTDQFLIHVAEAAEDGFEGMYQLLTEYKMAKEGAVRKLDPTLVLEPQNHSTILLNRKEALLSSKGPHIPIYWSLTKQALIEPQKNMPVESGDYFFLFNQGLSRLIKDDLSYLIKKVLKVFATDGLETSSAMLQKEVSFILKRKELTEDIHLLCFQILNI